LVTGEDVGVADGAVGERVGHGGNGFGDDGFSLGKCDGTGLVFGGEVGDEGFYDDAGFVAVGFGDVNGWVRVRWGGCGWGMEVINEEDCGEGYDGEEEGCGGYYGGFG
jgi:hypothetical protein